MSKLEHDAAAAELRQQMSTFEKPWYRSCSDLLRKKQLKGLTCLDLCSGNCEYSKILAKEHEMEVTCADYVPVHLQQARKDGFSTIEIDLDGDAASVDRAAEEHTGKFDLVVSLATIEHVFNSDNLLRYAHTVLKPGGLLMINTPNIDFLAYRLYSAISGNRPYGEGHHIRFWDYRFLRTNLYFNGFEVVEDFRRFYSLPEEILRRAFKNRTWISYPVSRLFYACFIFQNFRMTKGLASDELTVLFRKEDVKPIAFNYPLVKSFLEKSPDSAVKSQIISRLQSAQKKGWLKEHLYMSRLVDDYR